MPIVSGSYAPSAAPVSGQCQTTYMIEHYAEKTERRIATTNQLLETRYTIEKDVTRLVQCVDPRKRDAIQRLEVEPERLAFSVEVDDLSGRSVVENTFVSRMSLLSDLRCGPCSGAEVSGAALKSYRLTYDGLDTSAQNAALLEYDKQDAFHEFHHWSPDTVRDFYNPPIDLLLEVIRDYDTQWGSEINTAVGTTSFFSQCASETTSTGCIS